MSAHRFAFGQIVKTYWQTQCVVVCQDCGATRIVTPNAETPCDRVETVPAPSAVCPFGVGGCHPITSSSNNLDVPVRFSHPRMGIRETDAGIRERLAAACKAEGLLALDRAYVVDLVEIVESVMLQADDDVSGPLARIKKYWQRDKKDGPYDFSSDSFSP